MGIPVGSTRRIIISPKNLQTILLALETSPAPAALTRARLVTAGGPPPLGALPMVA